MTAELERLVRYCHPAKLLATTPLPGLDALEEPSLYGAPRAECEAVAAALRREADAAARAIAGSPFAPGERLIALGDSHTDDLASWAEILARVHDGPVLNAGVSGDTTTHVLARVDLLPPADRAIVLVGTNDARRHGRDGAPMLVSHAETRRNLRAIDAELRRRCGVVTWITPPPIDERRIAADPLLAAAGLEWRREDVAAKAEIVRAGWDAVDLWPAFGPEHLAADGLHPSPAGQRLILERLLATAAPATARRTA